jgi:hypothetical protein
MSTGTIGDKTKEEACHGLVYFLRGKEGMQCLSLSPMELPVV